MKGKEIRDRETDRPGSVWGRGREREPKETKQKQNKPTNKAYLEKLKCS